MHFFDARRIDVLFKNNNGGLPKHSSARNADDGLYRRFSKEGFDSHIYLRPFKRVICRIQRLVGAVSLYLDDIMGSHDDSAKKYA